MMFGILQRTIQMITYMYVQETKIVELIQHNIFHTMIVFVWTLEAIHIILMIMVIIQSPMGQTTN